MVRPRVLSIVVALAASSFAACFWRSARPSAPAGATAPASPVPAATDAPRTAGVPQTPASEAPAPKATPEAPPASAPIDPDTDNPPRTPPPPASSRGPVRVEMKNVHLHVTDQVGRYNDQLVAGYSKNTASRGLKTFMPDADDIRAKRAATRPTLR